MKTIRPLITYGLFPLSFLGAMLFAIYGMGKGIDEGLILIIVAVSTVVITLVFEKVHPKHLNWNKAHNDVKTDVFHLIVSMLILPQLLEAGLRALLLVVALKISAFVGFTIWPEHWPLILQLILAMLISQFGEYWIHRGMHEVPFLWRFHSVHHSPKRLYWLNAARFHPIDTAASFSFTIASLLVFGAPDNVLVLVTVWITVHGLFQHCNIDIKLGPLNYIFSLAELHRWHHSLNLKEANTNYGNNIIFWDIVFGTMFYPKNAEASEHIGLHDLKVFPEDYVGQLMVPFKWREVNARNE
jgi:sterol desaturase/sphingolipid hydroxylase (fatty acid hydroxylase superfamily)